MNELDLVGTDNLLLLADQLAKSKVIQGLTQGNYSKEDVFVICLMGQRMGVDPVAALTGIYLVKGRPYIGARLVRGLALKHGHTFDVLEWTADSIKVLAGRKGRTPQEFSYTIKEAAHAGLMSKENWRLHPRRMLLNAVTRHVMDACFADIFLGITTDDDSDPDLGPDLGPAREQIAATNGQAVLPQPAQPRRLSLGAIRAKTVQQTEVPE